MRKPRKKYKVTLPGEPGESQRKPKRYRRLVVEMDVSSVHTEYKPLTRTVWLQSTDKPFAGVTGDGWKGFTEENLWQIDLFNTNVPVALVADMVKFFDAMQVPVTYDPPNNMAGHLNPKKRQDQQPLFETD